jgi:hypothetical protein
MRRSVPVAALAAVVAIVAVAAFQGCGSADRSSFENGQPPPSGTPGPIAPQGPGLGGDPPKPADDGECTKAAAAKGYVGCDFHVLVPFSGGANAAPCFAVFLANASTTAPAKIKVTLNGATFADPSTFARVPNGSRDVSTWTPVPVTGVPPKQVAVLFLFDMPYAQSPMGDSLACPIPALTHDGPGAGLELELAGRGTTFHVETDQPVTAYDIMPFGGAKGFAPSANLLLPTSAWGTNYVAVQPTYVPRHDTDPPTDSGWIAVAAKEDLTHVDVFSPNADLGSGKEQDGVNKGVKHTVVLSAGEYLKWQNYRRDTLGDATGTILSSDKPIALWGGDHAQNVRTSTNKMAVEWKDSGVPSDWCCVDSFHQQIPPVSGLGFDYVAAPYPTRFKDDSEEAVRYRVVGVADGTTLAFDPPLAGAPATLALGGFADFEAKGAFRVKAQDDKHPFYVAQMMSYSSLDGDTKDDGDPSWDKPSWSKPSIGDPDQIAVLPPAQFLKTYAFFTDPTYATTSLVVTRVKGAKGFADVNVDCLGAIGGWAPASTDMEFARVDLTRKFESKNGCTSGAHTASSDEPFGIAVWGVDWWASYAYPAGGSVAKLNDVVVPAGPH